MKRNKYFGWRMACLTALLMCLGATRSQAQDFPEHGFISEIYVDSRALSTQNVDMEKEGYTLDEDVKVDLNKGVRGSDYVYVGYKRTTNPLEAITDIIVVYCTDGSYSGENKKTVRYNGRTYYPAKYGEKSKGGNLNRGKSGSPDLYFYYTKDRSAAGIVEGDEVVTKLKVQYDGKELSDNSYAKMWYSEDNVQPNGDLNKGAGGKYIYLSMDKHVHKPYKEKPGVAGAWECGCKYTLDETGTPSKSEDGYYNINNYAQFLWFCDFVNGVNEDAKTATPDERMRASARLLADIDLAEAEKAYQRNRFRPIGSGPDPERYGGYSMWGGTLDGCSHVIKNLTLDDSVLGDLDVAGLVGRANTGCVVKNLTLENVKISSTDKPRTLAGIIACVDGTSEIEIDNCRITGKIESSNGSDLCTAGIACICPESRGRTIVISNCTNCANVKGSRVSGILGGVDIEDYSTEIKNCINHGTIESTSTNEAIAFAGVYAYSVKNCLNTGKLITNGKDVGYFGLRSRILSHNLSLTPCSLLKDYTGNYESTPNYVVNADSESKATKVTEDQLLSGEICYLLNDNQSAENQVVWYQTLGTDKYPYPAKGGDIVYHYTECNGQGKYTNYGMFAEDVDHRNHELPYDLEHNGEFGKDEIWFTHLHCTICDKLISMSNLILKYHKTVLEPSCMADGLEEFCYVEPATSREYFGYRKLEKGNKSQHNPKIAEGYTYCLDCHQLISYDKTYVSDRVKNGVFEISNVYELLIYNGLNGSERGSAYLGYDAKLMNDIEMNIPYQWKPMYLANHTFDGNGHTISGFYCAEESAGFFNWVENSTVKNLTLEGTVHAKQGALLCASASDGAVIQNCTTQGLVNNQNGAAGICFTLSGAKIEYCRNDAHVLSKDNLAGGIVAKTVSSNEANILSRTANYGPVFGKTDAAGLIVTNTGNYLVSNCANYGPIEGYNKVGGLFAEVNPGNSSAGVCDTRFCISVGQTRILGPSNSKGAVVGLVNLSGGDKAHQMDVYYNHSQIGIGYVQKGLAPQSNITKTSDETFATGEICIRLNEANDLYSKESEHIDGRPIWGQKLRVDTYPSLFNDNEILYKVEANNSEFFVYENQVLPELNLKDKCYFHSPTTFYVQDITYDRSDVTVKNNFYATLYLPFAFQDRDLKVMEFDHYDAQTGNVYLNEVDQASIVADKPYLVRLSDNCTLTEKPLVIKAKNAKISPSHDMFPHDYDDIEKLTTGFYGTYAEKSVWSEANFYCISTKYGDFRKARSDEDEGTKVYPFRSVFKLDKGAAAPAQVGISALDNTDIRGYHFVENGQGTIYNLNGQSMGESRSSLKPGIYVQNGKKIIIK